MKRLFVLTAVALSVTTAAFAADAPKAPSAEQQANMQKMMKAATPGPQHEMLKKMAGEWNATVTMQMDPSQPPAVEHSSATLTMVMDRYCQEVTTGQMMGQPFSGMGLTGYDNVLGKYVSTWVDNMGTGIMTSTGTADASGKVITWTSMMSDPVTGKQTKERMVTTIKDDDHHTLEMYGKPPGGKKEMKMMTIEYTRK
jgi:Protein of unknown function (DUF1579)